MNANAAADTATAVEDSVHLTSPREYRTATLVLFGVLALTGLYFIGSNLLADARAVPIAAITAVIAWTLLGVGYWWVFTKIPYFAPVGRTPRWLGFLWGGLIAVSVAAALEGQLAGIAVASSSAETQALSALAAGPVEETSKALGILAVFLLVRRPRTLVDGLVIGATVGLGFELVEDAAYTLNSAWQNGDDGMAGLGMIVVSRAATSVSSHWIYSGIFGVGLAYAFCARWAGSGRRAAVLIGCAALAIGMHAAWDAPGIGSSKEVQDGSMMVKTVSLMVLTIVVILMFMRWSRNREGEFYVTYLVRADHEPMPASQLKALPHGVTRRRARKDAATGDDSRKDKRRVHAAVRALHRAGAGLAVALAETDPQTVAAAQTRVTERVSAAEATGAHLDSSG